MKKIIVLILGIILMSACNNLAYKMDGWASPANKENRDKIDVTVFEYEGHTYLIFGRTIMTSGVVHDPNCICHKKAEEE